MSETRMIRLRLNPGFKIIDVMILVAAVSLGMPYFVDRVTTDAYVTFPSGPLIMKLQMVWHIANSICPMAFCAHVAVVLISIKNRKSWSVLGDPGIGAGFVAIVFFAIKESGAFVTKIAWCLYSAGGSMTKFGEELSEMEWPDVFWEPYYELPLPAEFGTSILSLWLLMIVSKNWKANPTTYDLLGRLLGSFWIMVIPLSWFYNMFD